MPAFCPRIRLELREREVAGERMVGTGSLEQVRDDLGSLQELGAQHVILDWFTGNVPATANHSRGWEMLALLADQVLDLPHEALT